MKRDEITVLKEDAKSYFHKFSFVKSSYVYSPFISRFTSIKNQEYNASYFAVHSLISNPNVTYVTVLSFYADKYILKCGDAYLEGALSFESQKKSISNAIEKIDSPNKQLLESFKKSFKITPRSSTCSYNQKNYELSPPLCEHISHFLATLPEEVFDRLYASYHQGLGSGRLGNMHPELQKKFQRYSFKKPILLEGDKGSGKTYAATSWVRRNNYKEVFIGGHEQFESIDFLGHYIQQKSGELVWKDGALSEAFRAAIQGEKVVLIIDEILRIPKRELNILISSLSPINGNYVLRTGRAVSVVDEIAKEEMLYAPTENLWVIGTTNVGAEYAVESMDEALIDRFKPIRKDTQSDELRSILLKVAKEKNFSAKSVQKLMTFYEKMQRLHLTKIVQKIVNIRHLSEALEIAVNEQEIEEIIRDSMLLWVGRDYNGRANSDEVNAVDAVISKVYD